MIGNVTEMIGVCPMTDLYFLYFSEGEGLSLCPLWFGDWEGVATVFGHCFGCVVMRRGRRRTHLSFLIDSFPLQIFIFLYFEMSLDFL